MSNSIASRLLATAGLVLAFAAGAAAQDYPARAVRVIVGFPAGGANDLIGRMVATKLSERLGKQFVVDNRAGAGGIVGTDLAAAAQPDGYTLLVVSIAHTANPSLYKLKYDTEKAFTPIAQLGAGTSVLAVHPDVPAKSVRELLDHVRANPGKLNMAHSGIGTFQHMSSSMLLSMAKLDMVLVPFKGGGPATIDVVGGHTQLAIFSVVQVTGHIKSGRLRALGIGSTRRIDSHPDLPTIAEAGVPGYDADNWWGVVGPAGMPQAVVGKLIAEITAVQDTRELQETLDREGARVVKRTGGDFGQMISDEITKWAKVVKDGKIQLE